MDPITLIIVCPLVFPRRSRRFHRRRRRPHLLDFVSYRGASRAYRPRNEQALVGYQDHCRHGTHGERGYIKLRLAVPAALGALAGSAIGAKLAMLTPDNVFEMLLIVALPFVAFAVLRKRAMDVPDDVSISPRKQYAIVAAVSVLIGSI